MSGGVDRQREVIDYVTIERAPGEPDTGRVRCVVKIPPRDPGIPPPTTAAPPISVDAGIDTLIGKGQALAGTVPTSSGSFQVKVCCEERSDPEPGSVCRARCTILNQTP